ncbi:MAG TPA: hypothetical protein VIL44_12910 [Micromonospora sp.]
MDRSDLRTDSECQLWDAFPRGEVVDLGPGDPTEDGFDPDSWGEERCVRGEVITRLLLDAQDRQPGYVARIWLSGARIIGEIDVSGGRTRHELILSRCWIDEPMYLINTLSNSVALYRARLCGLVGVGWHASGSVIFAHSRCDGEITLNGAHITGSLGFSAATLRNPGRTTLSASRITVKGGVFCDNRFTALGEVRLSGASIAGQLVFSGATLANPQRPVLTASRCTINGGVFCDGLTATGEVCLLSTRVTGRLDFTGASITAPGQRALNLESIACSYLLLPAHVDGYCDLRRARIGILRLPPPDQQPPMRLAGLTYTDLDPDPEPPIDERIAWLQRDPDGFHPQPYEQLAAYYRSIGHTRGARRVLLAKHRARHRHLSVAVHLPRRLRYLHPVLRPMATLVWRIPGWVYDAISGYGYVPGRICLWLAASIATGAVMLHDAAPATPTPHRSLNALLLATDATLPTHPFGLHDTVALTGANYAVGLALHVIGYALALSVIPTMTRALNRTNT